MQIHFYERDFHRYMFAFLEGFISLITTSLFALEFLSKSLIFPAHVPAPSEFISKLLNKVIDLTIWGNTKQVKAA